MTDRTKIFSFRSALLLLALLLNFVASSQIYPVQTTLSTTGPYYNYLSYYSDENHHLQAIVTLTDFNSGPIQARLRIRIEGPGYTAFTNPNLSVGNVFTLNPGVPNFLNGIDLAPYLATQNLIVQPSGVDLDNLPEGFTTICIDVIRAGTSQEILSTNNCTSFFLQRFQPPQPIFPMCESNLGIEEAFYMFQWSPPIGYVPSFGADLNYTFSLYEWNDPNNYTIFETGQGLVYQTETSNAFTQLSQFDVSLQEGTQYVWRIQATISSFGLPVYMVENNGLSEPCTFTYGESISLEELLTEGLFIDLNATGEGEHKGKAFWTVIDNTPNEGLSTYDSFIVNYRKKPTGNETFELTWFEDTVPSFNHFIHQLEASTTYEVNVRGMAGGFVSDPSNTVDFTTQEEREYACGEADIPFLPATYTPLLSVLVGMQLQIGQFSMRVTEIAPKSTPGHYQGTGLVPVAFLAGAKAKVRFDDILIDDQYVIREGQVDVITDGLENWLHDQYMQFINPIYVDGTVDSIYVANGSAWVVVDGIPLQFEFDPPDYPIIINDENGIQYTIWPDGTVTVGTYLEYSTDSLSVGADSVAIFVQNNSEKFGFDAMEFMQWHENYEQILLPDSSSYFVANKSVGSELSDKVHVLIPPSILNPTFEINGSIVTASPPLPELAEGGGLREVILPASLSNGEHALYVNSGNLRIGKLNVFVYSAKDREVVIVPLTSSPINESVIQTAFDETFGEANINVSITVAPQWNDTLFTASKTIELPSDVGLMNKYSDEMRGLRNAYFDAHPNASQNKYYLFVVPGFSDVNVDGYMVRGKALGFVSAGSGSKPYAHELAHGMGALEHSWKNNGPGLGTTSNLMDYSGASELTKAQWKELRDVDIVPGMWDVVEDALYTIKSLDYICIPPTIGFTQGELYLDLDANIIDLGPDFAPYAFVGSRTSTQKGSLSIVYNITTGQLYYPTNKAGTSGYHHFKDGAIDDSFYGSINTSGQGYTTITATGSNYTISQNGNVSALTYENSHGCAGIPRAPGHEVDGVEDFALCGSNDTIDSYSLADIDLEIANGDANELSRIFVQLSSCSIYSLSFSRRVQVLNLMIADDASWSIAGVNVLNKLVASTPYDDQLALLNKFKSNGSYWIRTINGQLYWGDDTDLPIAYKVYKTIADFLIGHKSSFPNSTNSKTFSYSSATYYDPVTLTSTSSTSYDLTFPFVEFPVIIGANAGTTISMGKLHGVPTTYGEHSGINIATLSNQTKYPMELLSDGRIKVTQNYKVIEEYDGVYFTTPGDGLADVSIYEINHIYYLDPFDFVDVVIGENYGGTGFDKGDVVHVPVLTALLISQAIENDCFNQNFTIVTDVAEIALGAVAIATAAPSGGTSLFVFAAVVESIAAFSDIVITSYQNTLTTEAYNDQFYKNWNTIKTVCDIGSGLIALPQMVKGAIKLGNQTLKYGRNLAMAISLKRAVRSTSFADGVSDIYDLEKARTISRAFRQGKRIEDLAVGVGGAWLDDLEAILGSGSKVKIQGWIDEGLDATKTESAFANTSDKVGLLDKLENSKSIYHQRVHIEDWDNIPGATQSSFNSNGLTSGKTNNTWNNNDLDLPASDAANFVDATAVELPSGTKIYRVTGGNPAGGYWTIQKPNSVGEVIGGTAVQPAWNDFSKMYIFEVPQGQTLKVWQGTTARQPIAQGVTNPHLSGGDQQLFIPYVVRDDSFKNLVQQTPLPW